LLVFMVDYKVCYLSTSIEAVQPEGIELTVRGIEAVTSKDPPKDPIVPQKDQ
jgi:hypothetical protein